MLKGLGRQRQRRSMRQDLADAFVPEFTVPLAFLGSDKVEFTLLMEMLGVETHPGQDLAAAFSGAAKKCSNPPG